jgi:hypothetical protein
MSSTGDTATAEPNTTTGMNSKASYEAAHAVLFTNELLCDIMARLPLQDVVATTGVCRFWRDALKPSSAAHKFSTTARSAQSWKSTTCMMYKTRLGEGSGRT